MTDELALLEDSPEDLYENAPCGYLSTRIDGTVVKVNRTFETWTGLDRKDLLGHKRLPDLLTAGGRIYYETHIAPLLQMQGDVREIAVEIMRADGTRLPALLNAVVHGDGSGNAAIVRTTIFDATDRRRYEQALLEARRREHDIAERLQRSLLAGKPPEGDRFELATSYRPGVSGLEVGGDWHDSFWLETGETLALVVGDVVGRGIEAAVAMGQLRSALRALASTGLEPGALVTALDGYAGRFEVGAMTTLVYAQLHVPTGELRFACAGHPPPLLLHSDSAPEYLWEGRSPPLDSLTATQARPEGRRTLAPGSVLLLYSDGLVEHPSRPLEVGMEELRQELAARANQPASALATALVQRLRDPHHSDDVCLLILRL